MEHHVRIQTQQLFVSQYLIRTVGSISVPVPSYRSDMCSQPRTVLLSAPSERFGCMSQGELSGSSYVMHPGVQIDVENGAVINDAALVKLATDAPLTPLPLVVSEDVVGGSLVSIFGYGFDEDGGIGVLQSGQMEVSSVTENHIFAAYGGNGSNVCNGDSGGPAIFTNSLGVSGVVGITSTGRRPDCGEGDITLFANTQTNGISNWILSIVPDAQLL